MRYPARHMEDQSAPVEEAVDEAAPVPAARTTMLYRHRLPTRIWHWINKVTILIMIGSGETILNAHPHLYWGNYGANFDRPWYIPPHLPSWLTIPTHYNLALARRGHLLFALVLGFGLLGYMVASLVTRP